MQFYEYETHYQRMKKLLRFSGKQNDPFDWYTKHIPEAHRILADYPRRGKDLSLIAAEQRWYAFGCPYFKVFPRMASMMSEVSIDIPGTQLRQPYDVFAILMPYGNDFVEASGYPVKSILVHTYDPTVSQLSSGASDAFQVSYQLDGSWRDIPADFNYTMSITADDGTLESFFQRSWEASADYIEKEIEAGEYYPSKELVSRILRLAVATCFFGIDQHEMVMPDLPRRKIEQRARQRGVGVGDALKQLKQEHRESKAWTIGNEIVLPQPIVTQAPANPDTEAREYSHAWMRRGHMRWQACGEKFSLRKLVFVHPALCRPDLPMREAKGYRIPDDNLQAAR